jgi:hypothetical protein
VGVGVISLHVNHVVLAGVFFFLTRNNFYYQQQEAAMREQWFQVTDCSAICKGQLLA